jgi:hypothetical protein
VGLVLEGIAQQMLDLQLDLQREVQETLDSVSSNLTAEIPIVFRP